MKFSDHRFGVEIEFNVTRGRRPGQGRMNELASLISEAGVPCVAEGYNHHTREYWKMVTDASVPNGFELVSPPMRGVEAREQIRTVCKVLKEQGCFVNLSTGLHVHHDADGMTAKQMANVGEIYKLHQPIIDLLLSPSRRGGMYARPMDHYRHWELAIGAGPRTPMQPRAFAGEANGGGRYFGVNFTAYLRHGTIEFRQHQGSLNPTKIWNWIVFTQMIMNRARSKQTKAKLLKPYQDMDGVLKDWYLLKQELKAEMLKDRDEITHEAMQNLAVRLGIGGPSRGNPEGVEIEEENRQRRRRTTTRN